MIKVAAFECEHEKKAILEEQGRLASKKGNAIHVVRIVGRLVDADSLYEYFRLGHFQ